MSDELTVHIQGYGDVKLEKPEVYNEDTWGDSIADVVAKVMTLVSPGTQKRRFHPVMGLGGYSGNHDDAASTGCNQKDAPRVDSDG